MPIHIKYYQKLNGNKTEKTFRSVRVLSSMEEVEKLRAQLAKNHGVDVKNITFTPLLDTGNTHLPEQQAKEFFKEYMDEYRHEVEKYYSKFVKPIETEEPSY
jgi:hypothetical protein